MATTYDKASLVMIPSGVKEDKLYSIKPTDGSGDFTFSRGSDIQATRVNSSGLIEKAKVNLTTFSNDPDNWVKSSASVTSGQSGYDGTSDAWLLTSTAAGGHTRRDVSWSGVSTFSIYAKAGTAVGMRIRLDAATDRNLYVNLSTGSVITNQTEIGFNIEAVGGGWYRISSTNNIVTGINYRIYPVDATGTAVAGTIYIQDAQLNHGLIAQDYVETTTTAVVEGLTADLPRLDYSGGASCPSLLLEPSRTNIVDQSEYVGGYTKSGSVTTQNDAVSPEGVQNAFKINDSNIGTTGVVDLYQSVSVSTSTDYTFSVFAKKGSDDFIHLRTFAFTTPTDGNTYFDLSNGTIGTTHAGHTPFIEDYGNGWYRCGITFTTDSSDTTGFVIARVSDADNSATMLRDGTHNVYMYGFQFEAGSYPTSYIPTYGTAANRAFEYPLVNPQTMLGATEGSWFVNFDDMAFDISGTSSPSLYLGYNLSNFVGIANRSSGNVYNVQFIKRESGAITNIHTLTPQVGNDKFCFTWNGSNLKLFVNGVKVYDDNGFANYPAWDDLSIGYSNRVPRYNNKQTLLFPTQLTDAEAIALTTI